MPKYISLLERQIKTLHRGSNIIPADSGYVTNLRSVFLGIILNFFVNDTKVVPVDIIIKCINFVLTFKISLLFINILLSLLAAFLIHEFIICEKPFFILRDQTD